MERVKGRGKERRKGGGQAGKGKKEWGGGDRRRGSYPFTSFKFFPIS